MLPNKGISQLFIADVTYKDLAALKDVIYKGNIEIAEEDFPGLQRCAKILKVELPDDITEDEEDGELDHSGIIATNSCQAVLDSSIDIVEQNEEAVFKSLRSSRSAKLPISKPQRTCNKRKSMKEEDDPEDEGKLF